MENLINFLTNIFDWSGWLIVAPIAIIIVIGEATQPKDQKKISRNYQNRKPN